MDPEQVILDELAKPVGELETSEPAPPGMPQAGIVRGGRLEHAELSTVRFIKYRESRRHRIYYVAFRGTIPILDDHEHDFRHYHALERTGDGNWRHIGEAGGGGESPIRGTPWLNVAGGWGPDLFYAGGVIERAGENVDRVQVRFADGRVLEDDAEHDVALFITDQTMAMPATVALLASDGREIAEHSAFPHG